MEPFGAFFQHFNNEDELPGAINRHITHLLGYAWMERPEYIEFNRCMTGTVQKDSLRGDDLWQEAEEFKINGNIALKQQKYDSAVTLYKQGLEKAGQIKDNFEQMSVLYSNLSHVYCLLKDYSKALDYGTCSYNCQPLWYKGIWRMMNGLKGLGKYNAVMQIAFELCTSEKIHVPVEEHVTVFTELLSCAPKVTAGYDAVRNTCIDVKSDLWEKAIQKLAKEKSWNIIRMLLIGKDNVQPIPALTSCNFIGLKLHGLIETCSDPNDWKTWGEKLAVKLLQSGAKYEHLAVNQKEGLHAALQIGLKTGSYKLLEYILANIETVEYQQGEDSDDNTLLHVACTARCATKEHAIKLLLDSGVDPTLPNRDGKTALDLLDSSDPSGQLIRRKLAASGFPSNQTNREQLIGFTTGATCALQANRGDLERPGHISQDAAQSRERLWSWTCQDVEHWLHETGLECLKSKLRGFDGPLLVELKTIQQTAPKFFLHCLETQLSLSMGAMLSMSRAIREL